MKKFDTSKDYYADLGVSSSASADEIKKAYKKLALRHHPDRNPGDEEAVKSFKIATAAYEVLSDPETKKDYDSCRARGSTHSGGKNNAGSTNNKTSGDASFSGGFDGGFEGFGGFGGFGEESFDGCWGQKKNGGFGDQDDAFWRVVEGKNRGWRHEYFMKDKGFNFRDPAEGYHMPFIAQYSPHYAEEMSYKGNGSVPLNVPMTDQEKILTQRAKDYNNLKTEFFDAPHIADNVYLVERIMNAVCQSYGMNGDIFSNTTLYSNTSEPLDRHGNGGWTMGNSEVVFVKYISAKNELPASLKKKENSQLWHTPDNKKSAASYHPMWQDPKQTSVFYVLKTQTADYKPSITINPWKQAKTIITSSGEIFPHHSRDAGFPSRSGGGRGSTLLSDPFPYCMLVLKHMCNEFLRDSGVKISGERNPLMFSDQHNSGIVQKMYGVADETLTAKLILARSKLMKSIREGNWGTELRSVGANRFEQFRDFDTLHQHFGEIGALDMQSIPTMNYNDESNENLYPVYGSQWRDREFMQREASLDIAVDYSKLVADVSHQTLQTRSAAHSI